MSATPTALIIFIAFVLTMAGIFGQQVFETSAFMMLFFAYIGIYFGVLYWQDKRRVEKRTRREHSQS